ncbi:Chromosome segregation protein Spo0J, contains ParB-like nuclease domain [Loktanella fryxellensis]|uniref:Chromosome segregation protein Spo0J, contains ParB-like nuclease domain n=1 Tax=Loktanella fryxellensis TaxID=245187 RepID=A0A1H8GWI7_9RHOB|nr:ParB N-terminal domain-containing protein [Loktanella fryxellensis]SEN48074.1 Chromosome segregation protein Spo0J, contains ParB-like nuclease domain [Loktanella fryxellensis]
MAKRKRLMPITLGTEAVDGGTAPEVRSTAPTTAQPGLTRGFGSVRPPIADVAHDAASSNALAEVTQTLTAARTEGRLIQRLPLHLIDENHLVRDRMATDPDEMAVLRESLRQRGQQTAIEVVALDGGRYGLISGWRRLGALRGLQSESESPVFDTVLALVRTPADAAAAYVAMVEENEIRVGLSFYERARIVARSVDRGVFRSDRLALTHLFAAVSRSKRSKINAFITLVRQLDDVLRHPTALTERSGLALVQALDADAALTVRLAMALAVEPDRDAAREGQIIQGCMAGPVATGDAVTPSQVDPVVAPRPTPMRSAPVSEPEPLCQGLLLRIERDGSLRLTGPALQDQDFVARLTAALRDL